MGHLRGGCPPRCDQRFRKGEANAHGPHLCASYGWLAFSGTVHFIIDVVSQRVRGKRAPGPETTLFYGLHSSFALGQVLYGLLCLWLAWSAPALVAQPQVTALSLAAGLGWLAITFASMSYWQPKVNAGIFVALVLAAAVTA